MSGSMGLGDAFKIEGQMGGGREELLHLLWLHFSSPRTGDSM